MIYKWTDGSFGLPKDPQPVGEALEAIETKHGGITPKLVVRSAKSKRSVLHNIFEWDDPTAANKWREDQAGYLLRHIAIIVDNGDDEPLPVRAFVSITEDDERYYVGIISAMSDAEKRTQILKTAWRELEALRDRYQVFEELAGIFEAMEKAKTT